MTTKIQYRESDSGVLRELDVDAVLREGVTSVSEVTEHPVELGAEIVDHVRDKSETLTLEFFVSNTPTRVPRAQAQGTQGAFRQDPETGGVVLQFGGTLDRVRDVEAELRLARSRAWLWRIETALREYPELVLEQVQVSRDERTGDGAAFTCTFKRVLFVSTRVASVPALRRVRPQVNRGAQPVQRPRDTLLRTIGDRVDAFDSMSFFRGLRL
jgi:hypothetical protein